MPYRAPLARPVLLLACLATALGLPLSGASAADPYVGDVKTACSVAMKATAAGQRLVAVIDVGASGARPPAGRLRAVFSGPNGPLGASSVDYTDGRVVLRGPRAETKGRYDVQVEYSPGSGTLFSTCAASDGVDVGVLPAGANAGNGDDDDNGDNGDVADNAAGAGPQGALPDTGGPPGWLLPLAGALLVVGAGFLAVGQRQRRRRRRRRYRSVYTATSYH